MVRVKFRYFLLEIVYSDFLDETLEKLPLNTSDLYAAVMHTINEVLGDYGSAVISSGLSVKILNPYTRIVYLRAKHGPHLLLASALPFVNKIKKIPCHFRTLHLAGTIRSCHKFLQRYHHERLASLLRKCTSNEEREEIQNSIRLCLKKIRPELPSVT